MIEEKAINNLMEQGKKKRQENSVNGQNSAGIQQKARTGQMVIRFEFITLKKVLKMSMSCRSSIKSLKPLFANKLDYQFAHMDLKLSVRKDGKKHSIPIDKPINQIELFKGQQQFVIVEVEIIYEGG